MIFIFNKEKRIFDLFAIRKDYLIVLDELFYYFELKKGDNGKNEIEEYSKIYEELLCRYIKSKKYWE